VLKASLSDEFGTRHKNAKQDTQFYEDGAWELAKLRAILCGSYVYGFYIEHESIRNMFESLQTELEESTERLAEVIARPYLRTPRKTIIQIVKHCKKKRQEFIKASNYNFQTPKKEEVSRRQSPVGLVPPHLDKNLTDVEKIYAIYDWMEYNESKQDQISPEGQMDICASLESVQTKYPESGDSSNDPTECVT
jgi:ankyrin repeat/IBR domain-containing protein 1